MTPGQLVCAETLGPVLTTRNMFFVVFSLCGRPHCVDKELNPLLTNQNIKKQTDVILPCPDPATHTQPSPLLSMKPIGHTFHA